MSKRKRGAEPAEINKAVRRVDLPLFRQAAPLASVDDEKRTVEAVFSTGELIPHYLPTRQGWRQVMTRVVLTDAAADLSLLRDEAPVLDAHSQWSAQSVIGVVEDAWLEDGVAKARMRFSQAPDVEPIWQRIREGTLRQVSMGFEIQSAEESDEDGTEVFVITRWRPREISVVPIGADSGAVIQSGEAGQFPAEIRHMMEDGEMPDDNKMAPVKAAQAPAVAPAPDVEEIKRQAAAAERERIAEIKLTAQALSMDGEQVDRAVKDGTDVETFRRQAIEAFAKRGQEAVNGIGAPRAEIVGDEVDRFRQGAVKGVLARAGMKGGERNEFSGLTLAELARESLRLRGLRTDFRDRQDMIGQAFVAQATPHSTSDFANILADVASKSALVGWEQAEETYQLWTRVGSATDFKPSKRVGLGLISSLPAVPEGAEYTYGTVGDRGETITVATYGKMLKVTRQAIVNDDLQLFSALPMKAGRAARRTIGNLVYAVLTGNPTMSDGTALFHADHGNLAGSPAALSVTTLAAARAAMRVQKEATGGDVLGITPRYLIVPAALETTAAQLLNSTVDPQANKGHASNPVAGMAELIVDGRLDASSATAFFLAADPNAFDTIEVAFLDGVQEPYIEEKDGWSTDGVELKVRIDAGVAPLDWRTFYKNAGA